MSFSLILLGILSVVCRGTWMPGTNSFVWMDAWSQLLELVSPYSCLNFLTGCPSLIYICEVDALGRHCPISPTPSEHHWTSGSARETLLSCEKGEHYSIVITITTRWQHSNTSRTVWPERGNLTALFRRQTLDTLLDSFIEQWKPINKSNAVYKYIYI